ncbi:MAG TPA: hypothetical protein VFC19_54470 [Candidatus Limnocylindrales bacterium]|nr:hypothetical protein [Candidatus Limnocylindrales bacterium]
MKRTVIALVLLSALAGCGGERSDNGVASAGGTPSARPSAGNAAGLSQADKALKWAQCMREQGIDVPDPEPGTGNFQLGFGPGTDQTKVQAAMQACREYQPFGEGGQAGNPQVMERQRKFAQCMRDNGVPSFPDPQPGGMIRIDESTGQDPDFPAAQEKCRPLLQVGTGSPR